MVYRMAGKGCLYVIRQTKSDWSPTTSNLVADTTRYTMPALCATRCKMKLHPRILRNRALTDIDRDRLGDELINPLKYGGIVYPAGRIAYDEAGL
ncbi:hypothetical protein DM82_3243 [Burkholderia oklahomensis]|uniref:Uncharacterized protein n=1 Tax=Burkholderia oklahomensis TaxID=342113 RepID=A0AAI8B718_9BURK|nr:hypothetical protein DM82_3243 [Burkholderia oklahomensis]